MTRPLRMLCLTLCVLLLAAAACPARRRGTRDPLTKEQRQQYGIALQDSGVGNRSDDFLTLLEEARRDCWRTRRDWRPYGDRLTNNLDRLEESPPWPWFVAAFAALDRLPAATKTVARGKGAGKAKEGEVVFDGVSMSDGSPTDPTSTDPARVLAGKASAVALMSQVFRKIKGEAAAHNFRYPERKGAAVYGLAAYQHYLLIQRIPKVRRLSLHVTFQSLAAFFRVAAMGKAVSGLDEGFRSFDKGRIVQGYAAYRRARRGKDQDAIAVAEALRYAVTTSLDRHKEAGRADQGRAYFWAIFAETLMRASAASEDDRKKAADLIYAVYMDYRWIELRLAGALPESVEDEATGVGQGMDELPGAVRDAVVYGAGLLEELELTFPDGDGSGTAGALPEGAAADLGLEEPEFLRRLRAFSNRIEAVKRLQADAVAKARAYRKGNDPVGNERALRKIVYGETPQNPLPGTIAHALHATDPPFAAELSYIMAAFEAAGGYPESPVARSAYDEVVEGDFARMRDTQDRIITPLLEEMDNK